MEAKEAEELWDGLSVIQDWLDGGISRARDVPDFAAIEERELAAASAAAASGPPLAEAGASSPSGCGGKPLPSLTAEEAHALLERLRAEVETCSACRLSAQRNKAVFGMGPEKPLVLVVGEGPGAEEDSSGQPFVGPAGQLLDRMMAAIGLSRGTNTFIANIVKCRPPANRDPAPDEVKACSRYLDAQIDALAPRAILCLGRSALRALTGSEAGITKLHGIWFEYRGIPLIATFHPSALLRDESYKRPAWEDLKLLKERLGDAGVP